jgi:hypothetical protein
MNPFKHIILAAGTVAALATGAIALVPFASAQGAADTKTPMAMGDMPMPKTAADHNAEATKYDQEAASLDAKAEHHAKLAMAYRGRGGGGKQGTTFQSLADHCERLAEAYRKAALEARATAQSHREMAKMA